MSERSARALLRLGFECLRVLVSFFSLTLSAAFVVLHQAGLAGSSLPVYALAVTCLWVGWMWRLDALESRLA